MNNKKLTRIIVYGFIAVLFVQMGLGALGNGGLASAFFLLIAAIVMLLTVLTGMIVFPFFEPTYIKALKQNILLSFIPPIVVLSLTLLGGDFSFDVVVASAIILLICLCCAATLPLIARFTKHPQ